MATQNSANEHMQLDWDNREYISAITNNIKKVTNILNAFDITCRSRLANLNEKLTMLEKRIEYLEAQVIKGGDTLS
ncbi:putative protein BRICK1-A [Trichoplax sp. H2]|nr:putative protein BRICK1-A [Trichoplax sp. H2]|eukprot:RDD47136.1 putative protein BRICK1-A [Trichoplax sp. H2]